VINIVNDIIDECRLQYPSDAASAFWLAHGGYSGMVYNNGRSSICTTKINMDRVLIFEIKLIALHRIAN
jgi:hypothetical protein